MRQAAAHCGLDFGTSNSTLAQAGADGPARLLPLEDGRAAIPSAIFFNFATDGMDVGRQALANYMAGADGRMMRALKSILGSELASESTRIKRRMIPFTEIIGMFLGELKSRAEAAAHARFDRVVLGRPVHFVDDDEKADRRAQAQLEKAARAQGFAEIEFQFEPIAAALDYEQRVEREEIGLVVDMGGGTSDFSIVRLSPERRRSPDRIEDILANGGVHLGGTDFDRMLSLARVMPELGYQTMTADNKRVLPSGPYYDLATWHRINRLYTPDMAAELRQTRREAARPERVDRMLSILANREGHRLAAAVEEAKIELTEQEAADVLFTGEDVRLTAAVTRPQLEQTLRRALERIEAAIGETLGQAGLGADRIDTVILTGGSTQIPAVLARLEHLFPMAKMAASDAFGSVGIGLALDAERKFA